MSEAAHKPASARGVALAVTGAAAVGSLLLALCWATLRVEWAVWTASASPDGTLVLEGLRPSDATRLTPYLRSANPARRNAVARLFTHWWEQGRLDFVWQLEFLRRRAPVSVHVREWSLVGRPVPVRLECGQWLDNSECRWEFMVWLDRFGGATRFDRVGSGSLLARVRVPDGLTGTEHDLAVDQHWAPSAKAEMVSLALPSVRVRLTRELPPEELQPVRDSKTGRQLHAFLKPRVDRAERTPAGVSVDLALVSTHNLPAAVAATLVAEVDGQRHTLTDVHLPAGDPVARYWKGLTLEGPRPAGWRRVTFVLEPKFDVAYSHPSTHTWWAKPLRLPPVDVRVE